MAYGRGGFRRGGGSKPKSGTSVRLTGLFKSKTKRGLAVGSTTELEDLIAVVKKARASEQGLVWFLWRNEPDENSDKKTPDFTLYVDVNKEEDDRPRRRSIRDEEDEPRPRRKPVDDDDPEPEKDDEVPF